MRKGLSGKDFLTIVLILGVGYFLVGGQVKFPWEVPDKCDSTVTPDIDINAHDKYNPVTAVTDNMAYRKIAPERSKVFTDGTMGTEITALEPFATYEFAPGVHNTVATGAALAFGKYFTVDMPCKEDTVMEIAVCNDETYDGLSATFFNDADSAAAQAIAASGTATVKLRWKAGADQCYGNPFIDSYPLSDNGNHRRAYPNALCLKTNSTAFNEPQTVFLANGVEMRRIGTPAIASADGATGYIMYCYEAPVIEDMNMDIYVTAEAKAIDPMMDDKAFLYSGHVVVDTNSGELGWGVENNDAAYAGGNSDADELAIDWS